MPSPFPGMDPYLEDAGSWPDFHSTFVNCWREAIADRLPGSYAARIGERATLIDSFDESPKIFLPNAAVVHFSGRSESAGTATAQAPAIETATVPLLFPGEAREPYIELYQMPERTLVAVLELLSPTNKSGDGHGLYLVKRNAVIRQRVHLVELDLLLGGRRPPFAKPLPPANYYGFVSRFDRRPDCQVFAWTVRQPLPRLPIPLLPPDADVIVPLADVFALAYDRGRYARWLRYTQPPTAPLAETERQWAASRGAEVDQA
jgi:hypothetical protein